jgi:DNA-binding NarL/FixJ family response regulator
LSQGYTFVIEFNNTIENKILDHMNILLSIPHFITAVGLKKVLTDAFENSNVEIIESRSDLQKSSRLNHIDLVILDSELKSSSLKHHITAIKENNPETKVLIFGNKSTEHLEFHYMTIGANGFISKGCSEEDLKSAINIIINGNLYISETAIQNNLVFHKNGAQINDPNTILSKRELEVFKYLINGLGINQICEEVELKQATVSTLKKRIFEKYKVSNVIDLYKIASKHGYN